MTASNLVVPLVVWGREAPTHCISSIIITQDQDCIVTGCNDGQIIIWDVKADWKLKPRLMLFGHTAAVTCLARGSVQGDNTYFVSSADNGEMCLWDISDGRCIERTKMPVTHTCVQAYQLWYCRDVRLVCNGFYPDIHIVHPMTLEILCTLSSKIQPDWISALCILRPVKREDDIVVAISNSGTVKVWTLLGTDAKTTQPIYEDESKQIRCLNAQMLRCCPYNQRTVLLVCSKYWQIYGTDWAVKPTDSHTQDGIYDAGDFSLLCSESSRRGERWSGGEFIAIDRVVVWSNEGKGYLYKLPMNLLRGKAVSSANPESGAFRRPADPCRPHQSGPQAYTVLDIYMEKPLECFPAMSYFLGRRDRESKLLLRGDSEGRVVIWTIPDIHDKKMKLVRQESFDRLPAVHPKCYTSLQEAWKSVELPQEGLIDQLNDQGERMLEVSASIYIPSQGRLVCGRDDGTIVIVPAVESVILQLLDNNQPKESLHHQVLDGHNGRVNCLLYPFNDSPRYDSAHLVSGGVDFTVCLWDINTGAKLHSFCVHGGEIEQLLVPPSNCNPRILPCICSVASDHSLALLSLRERKSIMLAARQLFPIQTVKWRPLDDFLVLGCTDGTVYVWQMETGHLDRVVHGVTAEEILNACGEKLNVTEQLTNPTISIAQAFRRRNLATFRNLAEQQLKKAQDTPHQSHQGPAHHPSLLYESQALPMMIQGLRTNGKDSDSHVIYFDTEALIVALLSEEYSLLSPTTLDTLGFGASSQDPQAHLTEAQKKMADFFAKVKDKAENVGQKIQATAESAGFKPISPSVQRKAQEGGGAVTSTPDPTKPKPRKLQLPSSPSLVMEIAQLLMSCLHAWGLDPDLDKLCMSKLGLLRPKRSITYGTLSRGNHMALLLPGWEQTDMLQKRHPMATENNGHWQISNAVTTHHLLSLISVANTLMTMTNATFTPSRPSKPVTPRAFFEAVNSGSDDRQTGGVNPTQQAQTKQGWSLLAALHCVLLPDLIGARQFKPPQLEMLARRWQDRCLEIREAAQALFLAELRRIGPEGRKKVVDLWSPYLPSYVDPALSLLAEQHQQQQQQLQQLGAAAQHPGSRQSDDEDDNMLGGSDSPVQRDCPSSESRRKQATAVVMMGVLGAEFGVEIEPSKLKSSEEQQKQKKAVMDGFGLTKYSHSMHTSKALTFLLLQPPSPRLPAYTPIRMASVDLLGRGFTVWEPYLDVSAALLGLLELCVDADKLVPSMTFGLPLQPRADACRTARHALSLIATARPPAFIITMAKEVARYNALTQNAQGQHHHHHHQLNNSVLVRAKPEILRVLELLVDKIPNDVADLLVEVMDISVHCLDPAAIRSRGLQEVFPAICKFTMVAYCHNTRRICVGAKNGSVAFYELKQNKCQILPAHNGWVSAVAFSPDGKFVATYCYQKNTLLFWQTASTSLFGIGSQQTKCVKTYNTQPIRVLPKVNLLKVAKLVWVDNRTVVLLAVDGTENRFRV